MSDAPSVAQVHDRVALTVIRFLGSAAILGLLGVVFLVFQTTQSANQIDPSTVALVAGVSTLAGSALGALGSILASTKGAAPQPVSVVNSPADPIPTTDSGVTADITANPAPPIVDIHPDAPEESNL